MRGSASLHLHCYASCKPRLAWKPARRPAVDTRHSSRASPRPRKARPAASRSRLARCPFAESLCRSSPTHNSLLADLDALRDNVFFSNMQLSRSANCMALSRALLVFAAHFRFARHSSRFECLPLFGDLPPL